MTKRLEKVPVTFLPGTKERDIGISIQRLFRRIFQDCFDQPFGTQGK